MVKLCHFAIEILQDGHPVNKHADLRAGDSLNSGFKYIEVKEGKRFIFKLTVDKHFKLDGYDALSVEFRIDGEKARGVCYQRNCIVEGLENIKFVEGLTKSRKDKTTLQCFRFDEAETRELKENETREEALEAYKDRGSIQIDFSRVRGISISDYLVNSDDGEQDIIPRKVVKDKGSSTNTGFDATEQKESAYTFLTHGEEDTLAIVRLKYRTVEALIDQGIVKPKIIQYPNETTIILDDEDIEEENGRLKQELAEMRKRVKVEDAEHHLEVRKKKRKRLETATAGDIEMTEERPARRRMPVASDVVVALDD